MTFAKDEISREEVVAMMAGGEDLEELSHELEEFARLDQLSGEPGRNSVPAWKRKRTQKKRPLAMREWSSAESRRIRISRG